MEQKGNLASGAEWELVASRKDATDGHGRHFILTLVKGLSISQVSVEDKAGLMAKAWSLAQSMGFGDRFRVSVNGPGLVSEDQFHIHIVFLDEDVEHVRLTNPRSILLHPA